MITGEGLQRQRFTLQGWFGVPTFPEYVELWNLEDEDPTQYDRARFMKLVSERWDGDDCIQSAPRLHQRWYKAELHVGVGLDRKRWFAFSCFKAHWRDKYCLAEVFVPVVRVPARVRSPSIGEDMLSAIFRMKGI